MTPDERIDKLQAEVDGLKEGTFVLAKLLREATAQMVAVAARVEQHTQEVHHGPS